MGTVCFLGRRILKQQWVGRQRLKQRILAGEFFQQRRIQLVHAVFEFKQWVQHGGLLCTLFQQLQRIHLQ